MKSVTLKSVYEQLIFALFALVLAMSTPALAASASCANTLTLEEVKKRAENLTQKLRVRYAMKVVNWKSRQGKALVLVDSNKGSYVWLFSNDDCLIGGVGVFSAEMLAERFFGMTFEELFPPQRVVDE